MKKICYVIFALVLASSVAIIPATQAQAADTLTKTTTLVPQGDPPGAGGQVTYLECASTFTGIVKVWGLDEDPEISYQLKLDGMPNCLYGKEGDDGSNLAIGSQGRWWKTSPLPEGNIDDGDPCFKDSGCCVLGYLIFDCFTFTPDANGIMTIPIAVDSSYHVCGQIERPNPKLPKGSYKVGFNVTNNSDYQPVLLSEEPLEFTVADVCTCVDAAVDIGDPDSEFIHNLNGWGPIEPATHGGQWGASGPTPIPDIISGFVETDGTQFVLNSEPYYFVGVNYWYGLNLAMDDRPRLERELDYLKSLGITNLRIMAGTEGPITEPWRMVYALQTAPGVYDPDVQDGLDYLLCAMKLRNLRAVMCLTNFWQWSGGMAQYVNWNGGGAIPYPPPGPRTWDDYQLYASDFYTNGVDPDGDGKDANDLYEDHIEYLINRVNPYTSLAYRDEPAIVAWELANEPRGFHRDDPDENTQQLVDFNQWIDDTAAYIKSLDSNHLVTTGCEGDTPWSAWNGLDFIDNQDGPNIDYTTVHIWPQNWLWYDPTNPEDTYASAEASAIAYFNDHIIKATALDKPLVLEEFGLARDNGSYDPAADTTWRDLFFTAMYQQVYTSASSDGPVAGDNLWAWAGEGRPLVPGGDWSLGDPWIGDPPHEAQGWYSVYDEDASTLAVISNHAGDMKALSGTPGTQVAHNCRCIWSLPDEDPMAYVTLNNCYEPDASLMLTMRHLDGIADDSFDVEVKDILNNWVNIGGYTDWQVGSEEPINQETWLVTMFNIDQNNIKLGSGPLEVRLTATGGKWSGFNTYGQVAFDWIELCDDPAASKSNVDMSMFGIDYASIYFSKRQNSDRVYLRGHLEPDLVNGDGVDITEDVTVSVGLTEIVSMVEKQGRVNKWKYKRPRNGQGNIKYMSINWRTGNFYLYIDRADLSDLTNPVTVSILIGDDLGEESILMMEKKFRWIYHFARARRKI